MRHREAVQCGLTVWYLTCCCKTNTSCCLRRFSSLSLICSCISSRSLCTCCSFCSLSCLSLCSFNSCACFSFSTCSCCCSCCCCIWSCCCCCSNDTAWWGICCCCGGICGCPCCGGGTWCCCQGELPIVGMVWGGCCICGGGAIDGGGGCWGGPGCCHGADWMDCWVMTSWIIACWWANFSLRCRITYKKKEEKKDGINNASFGIRRFLFPFLQKIMSSQNWKVLTSIEYPAYLINCPRILIKIKCVL